jgi:NADH-quinone oxidoreductase subunit E
MVDDSGSTGCNCECGCSGKYEGLDDFIGSLETTDGSLIIILQKAQEIFGYLSRETITHISEKTGFTTAKIYGVATFYTQFRLSPVGKNLIMLCQGTACHVNGSEQIERAITEELGITDGQTTADGLFTLNNVACLGCCSLAPVMMVESAGGEETYGKLTADSVREILHNIREAAGGAL